MKRRTLALALVLPFLIGATLSHVVTRHLIDRPAPADGVLERSLRSTALGEDRPYRVHLPVSYDGDPGRRYPVIYVLDGGSQDVHTAESAALLARIGAMPEVIVVGIPNVGDDSRERDYTPPGMRQDLEKDGAGLGRGDRFLAFLEDELVPAVEREYRTDRPRMLAGYSRGGLFVVYSLIAGPSLFDGRFAHSPALWRDAGAIVEQLDDRLATGPLPGGFLFLSLGELENEKMEAAFAKAATVLRRRTPEGLRWRTAITRGATHRDNAPLATPVGLHAMFGITPPVMSSGRAGASKIAPR